MSTWSRPQPHVFKVNVSRSSNDLRYLRSIGCVMRNISGYWLGGYFGTIPFESELVTDLNAILHGFKLADEEDIGCVEVECNSQFAVDHVLHPDQSFEHAGIVQDIRALMCSPWESCVLKHVPPSSNQLAISLAHYALDEGGHVRKIWMCPGVLMQNMASDWIASL